jgi:hypothetical protein
MAYTTIDDPSAYFHTQLYTGDGSSDNAVTNDANSGDFKPDWLWIKSRSYADLHNVFDSSRGRDKRIFPNLSNAEGSSSPDNFLKSFDTDGFTTGNDAGMNTSSGTLVAWQWKANGGTTSSNTDGTITSTVQANTTAGFSIATWTGNGTVGATIGHGLGAVPHVFIGKQRSNAENWIVYHHKNTSAPETDFLSLNLTDATADNANAFNDTAPTSSVMTFGGKNEVNTSGRTYVGYFFTEKQGYSKFGSYTGNGSTDGAFIYTGFKPAWVMIKATDIDEWRIYDNKRANPFNVINVRLKAHTNAAESQDDNECDFLSNGIKLRSNSGGVNSSGQEYIYMAFAESPFVSSKGVPTTAR